MLRRGFLSLLGMAAASPVMPAAPAGTASGPLAGAALGVATNAAQKVGQPPTELLALFKQYEKWRPRADRRLCQMDKDGVMPEFVPLKSVKFQAKVRWSIVRKKEVYRDRDILRRTIASMGEAAGVDLEPWGFYEHFED